MLWVLKRWFKKIIIILHFKTCFFFFFCFTSQSTATFMGGQSVHLTTIFPGLAWTSGKPVICAHTFACKWQQPFLNESAEGRRMTVEIISWSISTKVWDWAGIKLATPGFAVRRASVVRHVTDCAMQPGNFKTCMHFNTILCGPMLNAILSSCMKESSVQSVKLKPASSDFVVYFSCLPMFSGSLYCKQYEPRSDCSYGAVRSGFI